MQNLRSLAQKKGRVMAVDTKEDISISYLGYGVCQYITPHTEWPPEWPSEYYIIFKWLRNITEQNESQKQRPVGFKNWCAYIKSPSWVQITFSVSQVQGTKRT